MTTKADKEQFIQRMSVIAAFNFHLKALKNGIEKKCDGKLVDYHLESLQQCVQNQCFMLMKDVGNVEASTLKDWQNEVSEITAEYSRIQKEDIKRRTQQKEQRTQHEHEKELPKPKPPPPMTLKNNDHNNNGPKNNYVKDKPPKGSSQNTSGGKRSGKVQKKEKSVTDNGEKHGPKGGQAPKNEDKKFNVLSAKRQLCQNQDRFVMVKLPLFYWAGKAIKNAFAKGEPNLDLIPKVTEALIRILEPTSKYGDLIAKQEMCKAEKFAKELVLFGKQTNAVSILCQIQKANTHDENHIGNDHGDDLLKLRLAYVFLTGGAESIAKVKRGELGIAAEASNTKLKEVLQHGWAMRSFLANILHLYIMDYVVNLMTLAVAYRDLPENLLNDAKALFFAVHGEKAEFDEEVLTVRCFMQLTVSPALVLDDSKKLALKVACELCVCVTVRTTSTTRNTEILPLWNGGQTSIPGGGTDDDVKEEEEGPKDDYCGGDNKGDQRRRIAILYFNCFLSDEIQDTLQLYGFPDHVFELDGFIESILFFAPSAIQKNCNFCKMQFFEDGLVSFQNGGESPIKKTEIESQVSKVDMERTLVFETEEQLNYLDNLLDIVS